MAVETTQAPELAPLSADDMAQLTPVRHIFEGDALRLPGWKRAYCGRMAWMRGGLWNRNPSGYCPECVAAARAVGW